METNIREGDATGNTFIVVYGIDPDMIDYKKILRDRHLDSALFVQLVETKNNQLFFKMRVMEKDGSESSFCGNGSRFLARFFHEKFGEGHTFFILVNEEAIQLSKIENRYAYTCSMPVVNSLDPIMMEGHPFYAIKVLGEPHLATFDPLTDEELTAIGAAINKSKSTNVNCVKIIDDHHLENKTYERGVNAITKACGSGSLGVFAISRALSYVKDEVRVKTKGGVLHILKSGDSVTSSGAATILC